MKLLIITKKQLMLAICVVVAAAVLVVGSVTISADQNRLLPIYCVQTDKKQVAISFDAAWGNSKKARNTTNPHNYWVYVYPLLTHI